MFADRTLTVKACAASMPATPKVGNSVAAISTANSTTFDVSRISKRAVLLEAYQFSIPSETLSNRPETPTVKV